MKIITKYLQLIAIVSFVIVAMSACKENITIGNLAVDMKYKDTKQSVVTGLDSRIGEFVFSKSSLPLTFEIVDVREESGGSTQELFEKINVEVFTQASSPNESEAMRQSKKDTVLLPAVEVEENTGVFVIHEGNHLKEGLYHFDMKITNVSGSVILNDVFIIEVLPYHIFSFREFGGAPQIEKIGDSPNQIVFKAFDAQIDTIIPANKFNFMEKREEGFAGIFAGDTDEGEVWNVKFPVKPANTQVVINGKSMYLNFALGAPGKYVIKLYK